MIPKQKTPQQQFIEKEQAELLAEKGCKIEPVILRFNNTKLEDECLFIEPWGTWITLKPGEVAVVVSFYPESYFYIDITEGCITLHCDEPTEVFDKAGNPLYV